MQLVANSRRMLLGVTLCATLVASVWASRQEGAEVQLADTVRTSSTGAAKKLPARVEPAVDFPMLALDKLARAEPEDEEIETDLFDAQSWYVPPPPPQIVKAQLPLPPPAPVAPPLPFVYMGTVEDNGRVTIYLAKGDRPYSVAVGDTIEGTYRVESLEGGQIVFTYLPMSLKQTLKAGS